MIDVKQAVGIAFDNFRELYSDDNLPQVLLEEVNLNDDDNLWLVTIGFARPQTGFGAIAQATQTRAYKTFKIDAETGDFRGISMRKV
jgi:hypothetical protein